MSVLVRVSACLFVGVATSHGGAALADEPAVDPLSRVVVTATLSAEERLASPAFTTVITAEDIARSPANSIPDLLRDAAGINNQTSANGRDEIQVRGMDGRYTLILVDGKRVSSSGALWRATDFDLSTVPLSGIARIEIVRGPMSALYGSDAIGGVVNIITRKPGKQWEGSVGADYRIVTSGESGAQRRLQASARGALGDRVSLSIAGEAYDRKAWFQRSAADPREVPALEAKRSGSALAMLAVQVDPRQRVDLDLGVNDDRRPYALDSYAAYPATHAEAFSYSAQQVSRQNLALTHHGAWAWGKTFVSFKREQAGIEDYSSGYDDPQQRHYSEANSTARAYGVSQLGRHALTAGVDWRRQQVSDPVTYLQTGGVDIDTMAVFAQDQFLATDAWRVTLGARLDHHPNFGSHLSPKLYANYFVAPDVVVKGGVSTAFKAPDAYQLSPQYSIVSCGGTCRLAGNPALTPEQSRSAELGIEIGKSDWEFSAVYFHNDVSDLIVAVYDPVGPTRRWANVAKAVTRGLEMTGSWSPDAAWTFKSGLTLLQADYTDVRGRTAKLEFRPAIKLNLGATWAPSVSLSTFVDVNYTGAQYAEGEQLPPYTRVDLGAAWRVGRPWTLRVGVKNLGDVNLKARNAHFVSAELGRNVYLSAQYAF